MDAKQQVKLGEAKTLEYEQLRK